MRGLVAVLLVGGAGCLIDVSYEGSEFRCTHAPHLCPVGQECLRDGCVPELSADLLVHWSFDSVTQGRAADDSGNAHVGVVEGSRVLEGRFGDALYFDGLGGSVSDESAGAFLNGLSAITVSMWVKSSVTNSDLGILNGRFASEGNTPDGAGISLRYDSIGGYGDGVNLLKAGVLVGDGSDQELETAENTQTTDWQHLAMTWSSGNSLVVYINGIASVPTAIDPDVTGTLSGIETLVIGKGAKDITTSWDGLIDDVRIYGGVLPIDEIRVVAGLVPNQPQ